MRDLVRQHDRALLDLLRQLTDEEWEQPSLCHSWTNRDVLAHLIVGYWLPIGALVGTMIRLRLPFDQVNDTMTWHLSGTSTVPQMLDELADHIEQPPTRTPVMFPARLMLGDHLTHHLDTALALDREPSIAENAARIVLQTQVLVPNPFVPARRRAHGLRLEATDITWSHGHPENPLIKGAAVHLISALGGRPHSLANLDGPGRSVLRHRITPSPG